VAGASRREFLALLASSIAVPPARHARSAETASELVSSARACRIRTITAGVPLTSFTDLREVESALSVLARAKQRFEGEGYEVQTVRIATSPVVASLSPGARDATIGALRSLDELVEAHDAIASIGPVMLEDRRDDALAQWSAELVRTTRHINFSVSVVSTANGVHAQGAASAANVMVALSRTPGGLGNFRFAAAANVPAGTPFFPVGYHDGPASLAIGLESAGLVQEALAQATDAASATALLRQRLDDVLLPIERTATALAQEEGRSYLGIDPSPAPGQDRSIGAALEALTHLPFGSGSTLEACAAVTTALKALKVRTCGYAGLMLPVLEDPVLAQRAGEGRFGVRDLLLYSSVCGTGLDLVPIPGDTPPEVITRVIRDVAALAARWQKALSARLFLVPGKQPGQSATFDDPLLTPCTVLPVS
jgi:uncharacterized protein (UPF0210 family)